MSDELRFAVLRKTSRASWDILLSQDFRLWTNLLPYVLDGRVEPGLRRAVVEVAVRVMRVASHLPRLQLMINLDSLGAFRAPKKRHYIDPRP